MNANATLLSNEKILELFNLEHHQVQKIDIKGQSDALNVYITLQVEEQTCPICESKTSTIKDYSEKKLLHSLVTHIPCYIRYRARRYKCTTCNKCFFEHNPFAYRNMKITQLTVYNVLNDLKSPHETFTTVANRYRLSPTTVSSIFDSHVSVSRQKLPAYLLIDECYAYHSDRSDYVCVLIDAMTKNIVDILPSRKKQDLVAYFSQIPLEERKGVLGIGIDMWYSYRVVAKQFLPNAFISVDRFHVYSDLMKRIDSIRVDTMKKLKPPKNWKQTEDKVKRQEYYKRDQQYYLLKKFNWLLYKNPKATTTVKDKKYNIFDPNVPKQRNKKLGKFLNLYDIIDLILQTSNGLEDAYNMKFLLDQFFNESKAENAHENLNTLIRVMAQSRVASIVDFSRTLGKWKNEICRNFQ
ncbi:hypothetical protein AOC36_11680 (plasmid) [Erysipelothrix larvae]|uniref:Transposase n=1 Tax=Erysipelothrix larvae TaxID=1514105 RepID=A0A0X8H251_9FIRM|nr:hypothetical protein AOC36_11680 [Erysipelothrix larvae]